MSKWQALSDYVIREYLGASAVFGSESMARLLAQVEKVAASNATVLIIGESGSGKEIIARALHHHSLRTAHSWVDINCAALPENLLESELFGHERGAFSGAEARNKDYSNSLIGVRCSWTKSATSICACR
jgi:transcriptional regulator with GAF, ATPase, and Fis domain